VCLLKRLFAASNENLFQGEFLSIMRLHGAHDLT
jgi:hypothetical protein